MTGITRADIDVMHAWGIRMLVWIQMTETKRAWYRANVAQVTK